MLEEIFSLTAAVRPSGLCWNLSALWMWWDAECWNCTGDYFSQFLFLLDSAVYPIMCVAHVICQFLCKEHKCLDTERETWMWVCKGRCYIHFDQASSYCVCRPFTNYYQPSMSYAQPMFKALHCFKEGLTHRVWRLHPQHLITWNLLLQSKLVHKKPGSQIKNYVLFITLTPSLRQRRLSIGLEDRTWILR